jgi:hypothetical protein
MTHWEIALQLPLRHTPSKTGTLDYMEMLEWGLEIYSKFTKIYKISQDLGPHAIHN